MIINNNELQLLNLEGKIVGLTSDVSIYYIFII